jgi:hypothetical protein
MKKFVCPSASGTSCVRHHAKASRAGAKSPTLAWTSSGIAGVLASAPASRNVALDGSQAAPTTSPLCLGSTFTSAPQSSRASKGKATGQSDNVNGNTGRPAVEYGKRLASALGRGAQRVPQRLRRAWLERGRGDVISAVALHRCDVGCDFFGENPDQAEFVHWREVVNARQDFCERQTCGICHNRFAPASPLCRITSFC